MSTDHLKSRQISYTPPECFQQPLAEILRENAEKCIECKICLKECAFLKKYGTPKEIARNYAPSSEASLSFPFECSLCGLCQSVCPPKIGLNPAAMFLEMRRETVKRGKGNFSKHTIVKNYENRGTSKRYSYYGLPLGCDTVLFPGCALPGTRPDKVKALFHHLRKSIPALGIVLDCCTKPSHDLGREDFFNEMFPEMKDYLLTKGVKQVLTACPNCHLVFKRYGGELMVQTVYEYMAENGGPDTPSAKGTLTVHDPCGTRFEESVQQAIRKLAGEKSLFIEEMKHHGRKSICCGEGGSVSCLMPGLAGQWSSKRKEEAAGTRILTYCAGCVNYLNKITPTSHILDLLFDPEKTMTGRVSVAKTPFTYLNRILLKRWFKKRIAVLVSRERTFSV
ncbi:MAG: (Fe-S)-binding protein [Pseudomonadota bacterium]